MNTCVRWSGIMPLILTGLLAASTATANHHPGRVSVKRLLFIADGYPVTPMAGEPDFLKRRAREQVDMYITGVIDINERDAWCIHLSNLPPHEVIDEVLTGLRTLPPTAKDRNAALAISDFLKVRFPCRKKPVD